MSDHMAFRDAKLMDQVPLKVDMSDCPVLEVVAVFYRERLQDFFRKSGLLLASMISSIGVNIKGFSKRIIELRPSLHPSKSFTIVQSILTNERFTECSH
jgi:hypothetical protein